MASMRRAVGWAAALCALGTLGTLSMAGGAQPPMITTAPHGASAPSVRHVQHVGCARGTYHLSVNAWGEATLLSILAAFPLGIYCEVECDWTVHAADPSMNLEVYIPAVHAVGDTPVLSMRAPRAVPPFAVTFNGTQAPVFAGSALPGRVVVAGPLHLRIMTKACANWQALVNVYPTNQTQGTPAGPPAVKAPTTLALRSPSYVWWQQSAVTLLGLVAVQVAILGSLLGCLLSGLTNHGRSQF